MMNSENIEKIIKKVWFKNHRAKIFKQGNLQILNWANENSICYSCRYVIDGGNIYITGDIGEAVIKLSSKVDIKSFDEMNINYFDEKLVASSEKRRVFDNKLVVEELKNWQKLLEQGSTYYDDEELQNFITMGSQCETKEEWDNIVNSSDWIEEVDEDYNLWIYDIGDRIPNRVYGWLIGLKMAAEQLNIK